MSKVQNDAADTLRDGKAAVNDAVKNVVDEASRRASEVAGKVKDVGAQAAGYVRDHYDSLGNEARHAYDSARDKAHDWEQSAESYVQQKPIQALLIAAGVGMLIGLLWKRHD